MYECFLCSVYRILFSLSLFLTFSLNFPIPIHGDFLLLYSILQLIMALHLLTIWASTWVPVPSDIPLLFLWVGLAKITLFSCLLYINAAGKVASLHLMRQLWLPPEHLAFSFYLGRFLIVYRECVGLPFGASEETLLVGHPLNKLDPTGLGWKSSGPIFTSCYGWAPHGSQGPLLTDEFFPHTSIDWCFNILFSWTNLNNLKYKIDSLAS